ncbi:hydroxyethylthiazole kinase [Amorphus sp. 3PC139-8]|uniref:hydroxyethylthiazole kinase n=1 Tax=Amorphus sp. 3PC139-8 TaxID=2735676 RepID=UPI00345C993D
MNIDDVADIVGRIRERQPLVHNITNFVVMNTTANALLSVGASPAMVHSTDEVEEFVRLASALVVNIGTLSADWAAAMKLAAGEANRRNIPWALDPVGIGATRYRTQLAADLVSLKPTTIRGNGSEIIALSGSVDARPRGVDSQHGSEAALDAARALAAQTGHVVAITGVSDYVTDGERLARIDGGHALMPKVTGLGCAATALIGGFLAVEPDPFRATTAALATFAAAGKHASDHVDGPGTLPPVLLDALHRLDRTMLAANASISVE